jgi:hypothetical protein
MLSKYLTLLVATGVLILALGLVAYPTPATAQNRPDDSPFKLFNPMTEPGACHSRF